MANHKSALKRIRQNERRRQRNRQAKSNVRTAIKQVRASVSEGDAEAAKSNLPEAVRLLHKAASKGIIPKRRADRLTSRLTRAVNAL